ncbi:LptF/LptG family permease [bacterium]
MKIITRYTIQQFVPNFLLSFLVFTFILLIDKIFALTSLIINKGVDVTKVIMLFLYTLPSFASLTFPMAFLMGTLLTLGSMQEDNEVTAIKAGGIPQLKILYPLLSIALISSICLIYFNQQIAPLTSRRFTETYYSIAYQSPTLKLEENVFTDVNNYRIFIKKINRKKNKLKGIIIYDLKDNNYPVLITADTGIIRQSKNLLILDLSNGIIQKKDETDLSKFTQIQFNTYSINFPLDQKAKSKKEYARNIVNMTGKELRKEIIRLKPQNISTAILEVQYQQRISIALACLTFILIGAPLALMTHKHNKAIAFGISLIVIFVYYILLATGISLGERAILPAWLALSLPNIVLIPAGILFLFKQKIQ